MDRALKRKGSVRSAAIWMMVLSVLLFWMPLFGPFIAGLVGGAKAGSVGNALLAALLPAITVGLLLLVMWTVVGLPIVGAVFAAASFGLVVAHSVSLIAGALVGAAIL